MKSGKVIQIETDHVLIRWEDGESLMTEFTDDNDQQYKVGDKVTFYTTPDPWDLNRLRITN